MRKGSLLFLLAFVLTACTQGVVAPEPEEGTFPSHPTAVVESYVHNLGINGMFASEGTEITYTRKSMQRVDSGTQFTGSIMKHLMSPSVEARISRVDKNLLWTLDRKKKNYTECPLLGCAHAAGPPKPAEPRRKEEKPERPEPSCEVHLTKNDFSVKKTGQKQSINGFDAEEYLATWIVEGEDPNKMKDTSTIEFAVWTTPESEQIKKVEEVQGEYHRAYLQKIGMGRSPMNGKIPAEAMGILEARLFGAMGEKGRQALLHAAKEMEKIKGFPISTKLEWYLDGKACGKGESNAERERKGGDSSEGIGGLLSGLMGKSSEKDGNEKATGSKGRPVFGFVQEIKTMKIDRVSDGLFQPPASYQLVKQQ